MVTSLIRLGECCQIGLWESGLCQPDYQIGESTVQLVRYGAYGTSLGTARVANQTTARVLLQTLL